MNGSTNRSSVCGIHSVSDIIHFVLVSDIHHMAMVRPRAIGRATYALGAFQVRVHLIHKVRTRVEDFSSVH